VIIGGQALQLFPLTELMNLPSIELKASGQSCFGAGLRTLIEAIARECNSSHGHYKGDWLATPIIFIADTPSDEWLMPAKMIRAMAIPGKRVINESIIVTMEAREDQTIFKDSLSNYLYDLSQLQPDFFKKYF